MFLVNWPNYKHLKEKAKIVIECQQKVLIKNEYHHDSYFSNKLFIFKLIIFFILSQQTYIFVFWYSILMTQTTLKLFKTQTNLYTKHSFTLSPFKTIFNTYNFQYFFLMENILKLSKTILNSITLHSSIPYILSS
jgi:hypothetical protein